MFNKLVKTYLGSTIPVINVCGPITPKTYPLSYLELKKLLKD